MEYERAVAAGNLVYWAEYALTKSEEVEALSFECEDREINKILFKCQQEILKLRDKYLNQIAKL